MNIDTLICARWIIPVEPEGQVLDHHAIAVNSGRIVDILPAAEARETHSAAEVIELEHHVLIPGLVNAHTHAPMTFLRGFGDDQPLMTWLQETIWPLEKKWMSESFVEDGTDLAIAEMLQGGITCFNDMYFFPGTTARRAAQTGIRASIGLIAIDFPTAWAENGEDYLRKGLALHDELRNDPLVTTAFAPHAPYSVADPMLRKIQVFSEELQIPIHMHVHETADEINQSLQSHGVRPLQRLDELGLLSPSFIAVHMTHLEDREIERVAASGAHVVHCPESNLKLASGFCPVQRLLSSGINVALGTDSAASNNNLDMLGEMQTAALLAKGVSADASAVPARTALRMATLAGARALGIEAETGSLVSGKSADITAINLSLLETMPCWHPESQIVYSANRNQVSDVWVAGRRLLKSGTLTTLDRETIKQKILQWAGKIARTDLHPEHDAL